MTEPLPKLLHLLAKRLQSASAGAAMLQTSGKMRGDSANKALRQIVGELQEASSIVQAMSRSDKTPQPKKKSASA